MNVRYWVHGPFDYGIIRALGSIPIYSYGATEGYLHAVIAMSLEYDPLKAPPGLQSSRRGRPLASEAGAAEARVLNAATMLFLEQGFGRTTMDQVAARAGAGKSSVYGRFGDKPSLFGAVVRRSIETMFANTAAPAVGLAADDRLRHVGKALTESLLVPRCVALMRMVAAEAETMPDLAEEAYHDSYEGSLARIHEALEGAAFPPDLDRADAARRFLEVAIQPLSFQAAFGIPIDQLALRVDECVDDALALLKVRGVRFGDGADGGNNLR